MFGRNKVAVLVAEFLGTGVLTLVVLGVQRSSLGLPLFVAFAAGLAIALLVLGLGTSSGAHLNPALTLALWSARRINTVSALLYIAVQLLGAYFAYALFTYISNDEVKSVAPEFSNHILVAEVTGAFIFAFGWAAASYQKLVSSSFAATAGLAFAAGMIVASPASVNKLTGEGLGLINPALALGTNAWVWGTYVLGPILGAVIGVNLYGLLFAPKAALHDEAGALATVPKVSNASTAPTVTVKSVKKVSNVTVNPVVEADNVPKATKVTKTTKTTKVTKTSKSKSKTNKRKK